MSLQLITYYHIHKTIMKVVVVTPENFMGDVIGDLNSKRGRIESMELRMNIG